MLAVLTMTKVVINALLLLAILPIYGLCQGTTVVAQIDTVFSITLNDVQQYVYEYHFHRLYKPLSAGYRAALEQIVTKRLKVFDFFDQHLNRDSTILSSMGYTLTEELLNEYFKNQYYDKYINETKARELYLLTGRVVIYQQIVLQKLDSVTKKSLDSLRTLANVIKTRAEGGESFLLLYKRYNHQQTDEAPHKHTLDFDQSFGDPLRNVIFRLPPNTVQILENDKAIYVVHVLEVRTEPLQPFDVLRSKLYQLLEMLYASRAISEFERDQKRVLNEKALRWNNKGVLQLKQWYTVSEGDIQRFTLIIQHAIDTGKNFSVVQMPNGEVDLRRFLYLLTSVQPFRKPLHIHENDVRNYIVESLRKDIILRKARKLGLDKKLFSSKTDNYVLIDEIAKKYNEVCIEQKIPHPTDDLVRKFYSERKDSIYYQLARVNIYVAYAPDTSVIYEFKNRLSLGIPFEKIDKRVFVKRYVRERNGTIRSEKPDDPVELGVVGFQLSLNEIAGPLRCNDPRNGEVYALIKCVYKEEEKQLMYDDIKEKVYEDYRSYYRELIEKRTLEQLRSKYKVRLYYERLEAALMVLGMPR